MNYSGHFFLGAAFEEQVNRARNGWNLDTHELLLGMSLAIIIGLVIFLWIALRSRKKTNAQDQERLSQMLRSQRSSKDDSSNGQSAPSENGNGDGRRRKRRRKRGHRPTNPTLSQTGGLPPPRPDDQLPRY